MARLKITAILLAGGLGSRIRPLFPDIPKPMIPIAGLPVIEWIVRLWALQGVRHFVLSTGYLGEVIEQYFRELAELSSLQIQCVREQSPLGTGGGVAFAVQVVAVHDALLIGNADSLSSVDIASCFKEFTVRRADVLIGTAFHKDTAQYGSVEVGRDNNICSFREKVGGPGFVNAGVYLMRKDLLPRFASGALVSMERGIFPTLLKEGAAFVAHPIQGEFLDIGTPAGYTAAEEFLHSLPQFKAAREFVCA